MQQARGDRTPSVPWRQLLDERIRQAVDALAAIDGVAGLILAGSLGRGEPWPLSDIDMIPIYEDGGVEAAAAEVEIRRNELLDWWDAEGHCTCLDVGKLRFTRSEAARASALPPGEAAQYLNDRRWFHSLDKGYQGTEVFDLDGLAARFARWLTAARVTPEVVGGRLEVHWRQVHEAYEEAMGKLSEQETLGASVALRESLHSLSRYLMELWGGRDNSWARFGTHLERTAALRCQEDVVARIMTLYGLTPAQVECRMGLAPEGIRQRHRLSLEGRRLVGEAVTAEQDARDVLLVFSTREVRYRRPPYSEWVGLELDPTALANRLEEYGLLLPRLGPSTASRQGIPVLDRWRG